MKKDYWSMTREEQRQCALTELHRGAMWDKWTSRAKCAALIVGIPSLAYLACSHWYAIPAMIFMGLCAIVAFND